MKVSLIHSLLISIFFVLLFQRSPAENLAIKHQVTGPVDANCYLVYGDETKEAARIDIGIFL